jgi:hypothetical protein
MAIDPQVDCLQMQGIFEQGRIEMSKTSGTSQEDQVIFAGGDIQVIITIHRFITDPPPNQQLDDP